MTHPHLDLPTSIVHASVFTLLHARPSRFRPARPLRRRRRPRAPQAIPALDDLYRDGHLPDRVQIVGADRQAMDDDAFRAFAKDAATTLGRFFPKTADADSWAAFANRLAYVQGDVTEPETFGRLSEKLDAIAPEIAGAAKPVLRVLPRRRAVPGRRHRQGARDASCSGTPAEAGSSSRSRSAWTSTAPARSTPQPPRPRDEGQIYRIDHYLGKETVQTSSPSVSRTSSSSRSGTTATSTMSRSPWPRRWRGARGGYHEWRGVLRAWWKPPAPSPWPRGHEPPVMFNADECATRSTCRAPCA